MGLSGAILLLSGAVYAFIGIKNKWYESGWPVMFRECANPTQAVCLFLHGVFNQPGRDGTFPYVTRMSM